MSTSINFNLKSLPKKRKRKRRGDVEKSWLCEPLNLLKGDNLFHMLYQ